MAVSDMTDITPIKKIHAFEKFIPSIIFVAINNEEMLKKDFALEYFLEVKAVGTRIKLLFSD